jgi:hypothetical protein
MVVSCQIQEFPLSKFDIIEKNEHISAIVKSIFSVLLMSMLIKVLKE